MLLVLLPLRKLQGLRSIQSLLCPSLPPSLVKHSLPVHNLAVGGQGRGDQEQERKIAQMGHGEGPVIYFCKKDGSIWPCS